MQLGTSAVPICRRKPGSFPESRWSLVLKETLASGSAIRSGLGFSNNRVNNSEVDGEKQGQGKMVFPPLSPLSELILEGAPGNHGGPPHINNKIKTLLNVGLPSQGTLVRGKVTL